jgi:FtsH-binding integral membrane protein
MENNTNLDKLLSSNSIEQRTSTQNLLSGVFSWMFFALCISAIFAYIVGSNSGYHALISNPETGAMTGLGWIITFSPLALVLLMSFGYQKLSFGPLALIFVVFSVLMGLGLSTIFIAYTSGSLALTFGISAVTFGVMAITGYTTKTDLSKFGNILIMALIGIIIASLINFFLHSSGLEYIISLAGVAIFTGLTAYDVQKIKNMGIAAEESGIDMRKMTIMGALTLYLDFVNLFLFLLRFFGRRR